MEGKSISDIEKEAVEKVQSKVEPEIEKAKPAVKKAASSAKKAAEPYVKAAKTQAKKVKKVVDDKLFDHEVIVQYAGNSYYEKDKNEKAVADYVANGGRQDQIKKIQIYIKPEDGAAYYVVHGKSTGKVEL